MATFFKYKEREDIGKSMIDWSGITKKISDDLIQEKGRRDGIKQELEVDQVNKLTALEEYTKGLDPTMNGKMLEIAQNYKEFLLQGHKMMKNGLVSVNETKLMKQGAMDTFNAINDVTKVYNEKMGAFIEKGGSVNDFIAESAARVLNIADSTLIIDPKSGRGSFVSTDENGNEIVIPATSFNNVLNDTYDIFDTTAEIGNIMKNAGTWTKAISSTYSLNDLRENPLYKEWKKNSLESILSDDKKIVSAAAKVLGMKPTYDKGLVASEPEKYFLAESKNGKIIFKTDGLKEKITDELENYLEIAISHKEDKQYVAPSTASIAAGKNKEDEKNVFRLITGALQGNTADLQSLANIYGFTNIREVDGKFEITIEDGSTKYIDPSKGLSSAGATFASALGLEASAVERYLNQEKRTDAINFNPKGVNYTSKGISDKIIDDINTALNPSSKDPFGGGIQYTEPNPPAVIHAVSMAARELGLPTAKVRITNGTILYGNETIGTIRDSALDIAEGLKKLKGNSAQQTNQAP